MEKQNFWANNLRFLRNEKKLNQEELSALLGISRSKLNAHENGQTRNPPVEDLIKFSDYFKLSIDTLLKIDIATLSAAQLADLQAGNDHYIKGSKLRVLAITVNEHNKDNVEMVPVKARAGYATGYGDPEYIAQMPVFNMPHLPANRKYRMFPITGDSMLPVPSGAFIIAEFVENWDKIKDKTACIVVTKDEGIVFKIVHNHLGKDKTLLLESLNKLYKPYEVAAEQVLEVWLFKSMVTDALPEGETDLHAIARSVMDMQTDIKKLLNK